MKVLDSIAAASTLPVAIDVIGKEYAGHEAMLFREKAGGPYSGKIMYEELSSLAKTLATSLVQQFGVVPEQNIAFLSENRAEYNLGDVGVLNSGAAPWGLYDYDIKNQEIVEYKLNDSGTSLIICSPTFLEAVRGVIRGGRTPLKQVAVMDWTGELPPLGANEYSFSDLVKKGKVDMTLVESRVQALTKDSTSRIIYTSGTTGKPKGVMLTHENLIQNVLGCGEILDAHMFGRMISYLPEAHSFQGFLSYLAFYGGLALCYSHKKTLLDDLKDIKPTICPGVPLVFKRLAEGMRAKVLDTTKGKIDITADYSSHPIKAFIRKKVLGPLVAKKIGLENVEIMVSGSAKLDQENAAALENLGMIVNEGYGISETSPVISVETKASRRKGSVGRPIPNVKVRILSLEPDKNGVRRELPADQPGEIVVRGPNVFKGYYKDDRKTAEVKVDGDYYTGDLGHLDKDGFLYVHGRAGLQVKMNNGEFVDLDHLAANILRNTVLVQAAVVDAEMADYAVAIVSLAWEPEALEQVGKALGVSFNGSPYEFARNDKVVAAVRKELDDRVKAGGGRGPSTPKKFLYVPPMSPETGEITSTMKLRVKNVIKKYKEVVDDLRDSEEEFMVYFP